MTKNIKGTEYDLDETDGNSNVLYRDEDGEIVLGDEANADDQ